MNSLGLRVFPAVAMNTDGFFSNQCIRFIFSMTEPVLYDFSGVSTWVPYVHGKVQNFL